MVKSLSHAIRALRRAISPAVPEEKSGFDHIWAILLVTGTGIVLILTYKLLFPS